MRVRSYSHAAPVVQRTKIMPGQEEVWDLLKMKDFSTVKEQLVSLLDQVGGCVGCVKVLRCCQYPDIDSKVFLLTGSVSVPLWARSMCNPKLCWGVLAGDQESSMWSGRWWMTHCSILAMLTAINSFWINLKFHITFFFFWGAVISWAFFFFFFFTASSYAVSQEVPIISQSPASSVPEALPLPHLKHLYTSLFSCCWSS